MAKKISVIVGSLRKDSFNRKIAQELIKLAPENLDMHIVEIGDLGLYNEDLDSNPPQAWIDFKQAIQQSDGVLFATPEYNRSMSGVLKNAIDVGSRPYGQSAWNGKPAAVISVTPSPFGAFGANHALRQSAVVLNMPMMQQPEAYIANVYTMFDETGALKEDAKPQLKNFIDAYAAWVEKLS